MPWKVKKQGDGKKPYKIVKADTGKVVGSSTSKSKAERSVRARYANSDVKSQGVGTKTSRVTTGINAQMQLKQIVRKMVRQAWMPGGMAKSRFKSDPSPMGDQVSPSPISQMKPAAAVGRPVQSGTINKVTSWLKRNFPKLRQQQKKMIMRAIKAQFGRGIQQGKQETERIRRGIRKDKSIEKNKVKPSRIPDSFKRQANINQLKFSDGMQFDTSGEMHVEHRKDGLYIVGGGMLIPVSSYQEAEKIMSGKKEKLGQSAVSSTAPIPTVTTPPRQDASLGPLGDVVSWLDTHYDSLSQSHKDILADTLNPMLANKSQDNPPVTGDVPGREANILQDFRNAMI